MRVSAGTDVYRRESVVAGFEGECRSAGWTVDHATVARTTTDAAIAGTAVDGWVTEATTVVTAPVDGRTTIEAAIAWTTVEAATVHARTAMSTPKTAMMATRECGTSQAECE